MSIGDSEHGIRFDGVTFSYDASTDMAPALSGVDLNVRRGELVAIVGPNGSGKSTLGMLANGLLLPSSGTVTVDGLSTAQGTNAWDIRTRVGLVFQNPDNQIVGALVEEDVAFGPENLGVQRAELRERVDRALKTVGLCGLERREPHELSGGQKQRLAIAGVLALDPKYLIFDEPTAMLDPQGRADVLSVIDQLRVQGRGIVHITHHLADALNADRMVVLSRGEVVSDDAPETLFSDPVLLESQGLSVPPLVKLIASLADRGLHVPVAAEPSQLVESLWP